VRGNYCTWNPLSGSLGTRTLSNGNLDTSNSGNGNTYSTFELSIGKWYFEATLTAISGSSGSTIIGLAASAGDRSGDNAQNLTPNACYVADGNKIVDASSSAYGASFTANDVIGVAVDIDGGSITFYKNGSSQGAISKTFIGAGKGSWAIFTVAAGGSASNSWSLNAGQRPFAYTAPSGFKALNTANLPAGTITTSGSFTGNANSDGPFTWLNGVPTSMTINGNAVTFGTHADKLANGFKVRSSSGSYNTAGSNTYSITATGDNFNVARAQPNP
jgi:hypothetical protein